MSSNLLFDFSVNKENKTVYISREFNAGLELVWEAWTTAELLDKWWGPKPFVTKTKVMNFEVGGRRFFAAEKIFTPSEAQRTRIAAPCLDPC